MKKVIFYISLLIFCISCEDVVEIDVPSEEPRLIVDALIRVDPSEVFTLVQVKVRETSSFFEEVVPTGLQQITITNLSENAGEVLLETSPGSGVYEKLMTNEILMSGQLLLQIDFEDEFFIAFADYIPAVPIDSVVQGDETLFDEDETEVIVTFTDTPDRDDYYLFDFDFGNFLATEDTFYQGQQFEFSYFYDEDMLPGQTATISIMGVDQQFYNYMNQLIEQSGEDSFGPFQTPAVTVRGNFINVTEIDNIDNFDNVDMSDNFALGYFAVVGTYTQQITIE